MMDLIQTEGRGGKQGMCISREKRKGIRVRWFAKSLGTDPLHTLLNELAAFVLALPGIPKPMLHSCDNQELLKAT